MNQFSRKEEIGAKLVIAILEGQVKEIIESSHAGSDIEVKILDKTIGKIIKQMQDGNNRIRLEKLYKLKGDYSLHATDQMNYANLMKTEFGNIIRWMFLHPLSVFLHKLFFIKFGIKKFKLKIDDIRKRIEAERAEEEAKTL